MAKKKEETKGVDSISIKNGQVNFLARILDIPLHGDQARARTRFMRMAQPKLEEIEKERIALVEKFADKDEEGKAKFDQKSSQYIINPEGIANFNKEYSEYGNQEYVIDVLPSNKQDLKLIPVILNESTQDLNTAEDMIRQELIETFKTL